MSRSRPQWLWYGAGNQGVAEIMQDAADAIAAGAHLKA